MQLRALFKQKKLLEKIEITLLTLFWLLGHNC